MWKLLSLSYKTSSVLAPSILPTPLPPVVACKLALMASFKGHTRV